VKILAIKIGGEGFFFLTKGGEGFRISKKEKKVG
jgi:hypothetical protein